MRSISALYLRPVEVREVVVSGRRDVVSVQERPEVGDAVRVVGDPGADHDVERLAPGAGSTEYLAERTEVPDLDVDAELRLRSNWKICAQAALTPLKPGTWV